MTGVAPEDETDAIPTDAPAEVSQFAGETPAGRGDGAVQIAYLHSSRVSHSWHLSLMNAIAYDKSVGQNVIRSAPFAVSCSGPNSLVEGRNMAVTHFLDKTEHEWLFFVDTDMGFRPDAVEALLVAADPETRPVVGGLCFALKHMGPDNKGGFVVRPVPTLFMWGKNDKQGHGFVSRFRYPPEALVQVAGTGAAFLLIHRTVLNRMRVESGDTWFNMIAYQDGTSVSEDLSFCYRVGQLGKPIFVHTGIQITHHKEFWLDERDYRMPDTEPMAAMMERKPCAGCGNISCDGGWGCLPTVGHEGSDRFTGGDRKDEP